MLVEVEVEVVVVVVVELVEAAHFHLSGRNVGREEFCPRSTTQSLTLTCTPNKRRGAKS